MAYCAYCESWVERVSAMPCASCGKPTNGAPADSGSSTESDSKVAIAVIVSVVLGSVLLGILVALVMPDLGGAKQQTRQERTLASIRTVGTLVEAYGRDHKVYPRAESMEELQTLLAPKYASELPLLDAWGNDLRYGCSDEPCTGYAITSSGADRMFEHFYTSKYSKGTTTNLDCDIVWADGTFLQYPEGTSP